MFTYLLITVNTHIFVSLALQKRNNFRQEYSSIVLSDFVICCKLGHLSYLEKNVGAKGNLKKSFICITTVNCVKSAVINRVVLNYETQRNILKCETKRNETKYTKMRNATKYIKMQN